MASIRHVFSDDNGLRLYADPLAGSLDIPVVRSSVGRTDAFRPTAAGAVGSGTGSRAIGFIRRLLRLLRGSRAAGRGRVRDKV